MKKLFILLLGLFWCYQTQAATVTAVPVLTFTQSIGINTHIGKSGSFYDPSNLPAVEASLQYMGVSYVREYCIYTAYYPYYQQVYAATGIRFDCVLSPSNGQPYSSQLSFVQQNSSLIQEIEGCNEVNLNACSWNSQTGLAGGRAFQYQLLTDISPLCLPLNTLTITVPADTSTVGALPANYFSCHYYLQGDVASGSSCVNQICGLQEVEGYYQPLAPGKPAKFTEDGSWTVPCTTGYDQNTQAKSMLNSIFQSFIIGASELMIYELSDEVSDPTCTTIEDHYGITDYLGVPKVAGTSLHNLTTLLADTKKITAGSLSYTFTSLPANGYSLLLQKSDGTYWLAIGNDAQIWNFSTYMPITVNPVSVTLNLGITATTINVYDPYIGTSVQQTASNANSIVLSVPDHVILVNVRP